MKKYLLVILLFVNVISVLPQNREDNENLLITYQYESVSGFGGKTTDRLALNIQGQTSGFYSTLMDRRLVVQDSMSAKGSSTGEYLNELSKLPIGDIRYRIYKNYPKAGMLTYIEDMYVAGWYQYEETQEKPVWIINSEKKEILGYACQKATTLFRGRTWIAWYTTAIPVNDGPWKLWGLPGLILEANDSKDIYHFTALGIKKMDANQLIQLPKKRYIKCTRKELSQLKLEYSRDPLGFMERLSGAKVVEVGKGTPERKSLNYEPMETDLK